MSPHRQRDMDPDMVRGILLTVVFIVFMIAFGWLTYRPLAHGCFTVLFRVICP